MQAAGTRALLLPFISTGPCAPFEADTVRGGKQRPVAVKTRILAQSHSYSLSYLRITKRLVKSERVGTKYGLTCAVAGSVGGIFQSLCVVKNKIT